ncbi:carbohydrate ABC transporter permease [Haladaptatus salinisoli]|uniref:carbohydrate ABC transporter permease n=1 Tax=Haladaptatus salinisoli TaxID=2884876 RepID=UPI001D0A8B60|nr:sugar ABC transporter permease [Haladaptatus salinisoli]
MAEVSDSRATRTDIGERVRSQFDDLSENQVGLLLVAPLVVLLAILYLYPILQAFLFSLQEISLFATGGEWIGATHYIEILQSGRFWNAFQNGIVYTIGSVAVTLVIGVSTALVLNRSFVGERVITGLILSPYMIPIVGIVIVFRWFFNGLSGVANYAFVQLGIISEPIAWFSDPAYAMPILILISGWALYPFVTMLVLAKLQTIPEEYYEAAQLMGASRTRQFLSITLPQLRSVLFVAILLRMLWTFNLFDIIWLGTQGGPGNATETLPVMAYRIALDGLKLGEGTAVAFLTFIVLAIGTSIYFKAFGEASA